MLQFASLIVLLVIAWYAKETSLSLVRLRVFLDARDIEHRKDRSDDRKARGVRAQANDIWLRDTRAIWGKLFWSTERLRVIGEELVAQERTTIEINPEIQPALEETGERLSWEELKRQGLIGSSVHGGRTVQRGERKAKT